MKIKLYEFKYENYDPQYIFSINTSIDDIRKIWSIWDHGDIPWMHWKKTWKEGNAKEIKSIDEVPIYYRTCIPYCTDERVDNEELGGEFFDLDIDIGTFFFLYYGVEYACN